jgi:hypothetical protein
MGCRNGGAYSRRMLSALLIAAAAVWVSGVVLVIVHVRRAPVAVEDETGFHVISEATTGERSLAPALGTA